MVRSARMTMGGSGWHNGEARDGTVGRLGMAQWGAARTHQRPWGFDSSRNATKKPPAFRGKREVFIFKETAALVV